MSAPTCPRCQSSEFVVGQQIQGVYDGVLFWGCIGCEVTFHRFPEGDPRRARAEKYVDG